MNQYNKNEQDVVGVCEFIYESSRESESPRYMYNLCRPFNRILVNGNMQPSLLLEMLYKIESTISNENMSDM